MLCVHCRKYEGFFRSVETEELRGMEHQPKVGFNYIINNNLSFKHLCVTTQNIMTSARRLLLIYDTSGNFLTSVKNCILKDLEENVSGFQVRLICQKSYNKFDGLDSYHELFL